MIPLDKRCRMCCGTPGLGCPLQASQSRSNTRGIGKSEKDAIHLRKGRAHEHGGSGITFKGIKWQCGWGVQLEQRRSACVHVGEKGGDEARKVFCTFTWALCCWLPISPSVPDRIQSSFLVLISFWLERVAGNVYTSKLVFIFGSCRPHSHRER